MCNELVVELIIEPWAKVIQNREGKSVRDSQIGGMESKQGRRAEEVRLSRETRSYAAAARPRRSFTTDGVAEKDGQKIDHVKAAKTLPRKAYLLAELGQDAVLSQVLDNEHDFPKPGWRRWLRPGDYLDINQGMRHTN